MKKSHDPTSKSASSKTKVKSLFLINDDKRRADPKKGATPYRYMSAPDDVTEKFLKSVKKKY